MAEDMEMIPRLVCLRSGQEGIAQMLQGELDELGLDARAIYGADVYQSKMALTEVGPEMVVGSQIEQHAVAELDIPYVFRLVNPTSRYRMIDRAYWGYVGMLNLIEFIQNDWRDRYRSKHRRYKARW
jgi:nitrogenase molybdenum-iron protein alpha/beta subunit